VPNRLASALSPYLRQHADNPVDWWEWSDEAFAEARRRDVPVLLSVGYAACHWCHVMAHESFEDAETAAQMNDGFVCIKVDREERPDVDAVHMSALVALTRQGGWPMTVFLTPEGTPFHAGTYLPPVPVRGVPSFRQVLAAVTESWLERRDDVERQAASLVAYLRAGAEQEGGAYATPVSLDGATVAPSARELAGAVSVLVTERDNQNGGFGDAPKFPPSMTLEHLLRHHARTGDPVALATVRATAAAMASGGLYDQLGGGFARYSVDATWTVPHFEKMLYDNAQLVGVYARLWRATGDVWARRVALETAGFMTREMLASGGFAASLDADTDGVEGRYYVWTPDQIAEALASTPDPDDAAWVARTCGVTTAGTFDDGASVLRLHPEAFTTAPPPGEEPELVDADRGARWARIRPVLRAVRARRTPPGRDEKIVTAWNGLAIGSFAEAGRILDAPHLVEVAEAVADHVVTLHLREGRLRRASLADRLAEAEGALEDYALLADGLLTLFAATGASRWFTTARSLVETALDLFVSGSRVYDSAADVDGPALFVRAGDPTDNASPSGRSALAGVLVRLGAMTGDLGYRLAADATLAPYRALATGAPRFAGWGLAVAEALLDGPREVVIVGDDDPRDLAAGPLALAAWAAHAPGVVIVVGNPDGPVPALAGRVAIGGEPTAYVCRGASCSLPIMTPAELAANLATP